MAVVPQSPVAVSLRRREKHLIPQQEQRMQTKHQRGQLGQTPRVKKGQGRCERGRDKMTEATRAMGVQPLPDDRKDPESEQVGLAKTRIGFKFVTPNNIQISLSIYRYIYSDRKSLLKQKQSEK